MSESHTIDAYCERLEPGLFAEPLNAITNLAFLLAAFLVWQQAKKHPQRNPSNAVLIGLIAAIGIGSGLFHTFATPWSAMLDVLPIVIFQLVYFGVYLQRFWHTAKHWTGIALLGYLLLMFSTAFLPPMLNGSMMYAPALFVLVLVAIFHLSYRKPGYHWMLSAPILFILSLTFRTIDEALCTHIPIGTHLWWHILNAVLLYVLMRALMSKHPSKQS